jgi:GntR family transcriptional repressor for pyruvate dehydrogenase complex
MIVDRPPLTIGRNKTLAEVAFEAMLKLISEGSWSPRMRLPTEAELAREFGMSRPVIRQALARLREMGLVQSRQGSGSFVCEAQPAETIDPQIQFPSISNLADLEAFLNYREGIEGEAAATAARRHTETQIQNVVATFNILMREGTAQADYAVHLAIARASNNSFYVNALASVREQMMFGLNLEWNFSGTQPAFRDAVATQHEAILAAIRQRDGEAARSAMRSHLRWTRSKLLTGEESV